MAEDRYVVIDEEGYFAFDGRRVDDEELGRLLLSNLKSAESDRWTTEMDGQKAWVEAFDAPLVATHVRRSAKTGFVDMDVPYRATATFSLETLCFDEWDRFHGLTTDGIPFVFSRNAQVEFFDLLDGFDDESVSLDGKQYPVPAWLGMQPQVQKAQFWSDIYKNEKPGWDMGRETVILPSVLPQLKLGKSRVLVLGCGNGHDAAYFASQGHVVTAVDFSAEAIANARATYGHLENLTFVQADVFDLPESWNGRFDLIFEHTCYCAISPDRRSELVRQWRRLLHDQGHLLAIFFVMEKRQGPPFGGSEWEVRERLKRGKFSVLFWTRWRHSVNGRQSKELVVYART